MPDFALGQICAWEMAGREASAIATVFLKDSQDRTEIPALAQAAKGVLEGFQILDADIKGATTVEKLFHGIYLADYVSYYVALAAEVDPTPLGLAKQVEDWLNAEEAPEISAARHRKRLSNRRLVEGEARGFALLLVQCGFAHLFNASHRPYSTCSMLCVFIGFQPSA